MKERLIRVYDQFWEWVAAFPEPVAVTVFMLAVGTLLCLWMLALLYFAWQALRWVGKA
jgi:RsiW-degrading membrane proteinase PrsW (M82 family)